MAKPQSSAFVLRFLKFKKQSGFLLIELMMAIFIGLVLTSSLMRMQALILELQDSFYMRDKALGLALGCFECEVSDKHSIKPGGSMNYGRDFRLNVEQNALAQYSFGESDKNQSDKNKLITKVKVEWKSLVGKNCCLEI